MSARSDIAAAVNTVDGLTAHENGRSATDPGTVYVRLDRVEWPNPFGGIEHWGVVLVLPPSAADAERFLDDHLEPLRAAVDPHLVVTSMTRYTLNLPSVGSLSVASINGHRAD